MSGPPSHLHTGQKSVVSLSNQAERRRRTGTLPWTCRTDGLQNPLPVRTFSCNMSTDEAAGQREEGEYGRAAKRLKTDEPGPEDELEEGEDSDSGSLLGNGEAETRSRARWKGGRKVRERRDIFKNLFNQTLQHCKDRRVVVRVSARLLLLF